MNEPKLTIGYLENISPNVNLNNTIDDKLSDSYMKMLLKKRGVKVKTVKAKDVSSSKLPFIFVGFNTPGKMYLFKSLEKWMKLWKSIENYPGYLISNLGRLYNTKSKKTNKFCKGGCDGRYLRFLFKRGGKSESIHRLVAEAFIPNPENKPYVNHIDRNTKNNKADNLEWCTQCENMIHRYSFK